MPTIPTPPPAPHPASNQLVSLFMKASSRGSVLYRSDVVQDVIRVGLLHDIRKDKGALDALAHHPDLTIGILSNITSFFGKEGAAFAIEVLSHEDALCNLERHETNNYRGKEISAVRKRIGEEAFELLKKLTPAQLATVTTSNSKSGDFFFAGDRNFTLNRALASYINDIESDDCQAAILMSPTWGCGVLTHGNRNALVQRIADYEPALQKRVLAVPEIQKMMMMFHMELPPRSIKAEAVLVPAV